MPENSAVVHDVVVIGGGIAGLTVAHQLSDLDVKVFDADDHAGGRTYSQQINDAVWANFGAQYLLPDKAGMVHLAESLDVPLITVPHIATHDVDAFLSSPTTKSQFVETEERLAKEQATPRDPNLTELDDTSFAEWLGDRPADELEAWEHWCQSSISGSSIHTSLYGALVLWGKHRSGAFDDDPVIYHDRGECVVDGGTGQIAAAIAARLGPRLELTTPVLSALPDGDGYAVVVATGSGLKVVQARIVVSAVPAPIAADLFVGLPDWKSQVLQAVPYGRFISTPIVITPASEDRPAPQMVPYRAGHSYNDNLFMHKTPGDLDEIGGCFHSYMYDAHARVVWDDDDESIKAGATAALLRTRPELENRIDHVGIRRWRYGNPQYFIGRMKLLPALKKSVNGIHFCGDYTDLSNTEGALRSGQRVSAEVRAALGGNPP